MIVKELLEMYDNWNGVTKINDDNLNCIVKDKTHVIAENKDIINRDVVSFGFIDGEFCIRVKTTVYDAVQKMRKNEFTNFCLNLYRMGLQDGADNVSDECWIAVYFADCSMKQCTDWFNGELKWEENDDA